MTEPENLRRDRIDLENRNDIHIENMLIKWITLDLIPLDIVESVNFRNFMDCFLARHYSRGTIRTKIITKAVQATVKMRTLLQGKKVSVTTDGWTSCELC
jgi:hypothetical protein